MHFRLWGLRDTTQLQNPIDIFPDITGVVDVNLVANMEDEILIGAASAQPWIGWKRSPMRAIGDAKRITLAEIERSAHLQTQTDDHGDDDGDDDDSNVDPLSHRNLLLLSPMLIAVIPDVDV